MEPKIKFESKPILCIADAIQIGTDKYSKDHLLPYISMGRALNTFGSKNDPLSKPIVEEYL